MNLFDETENKYFEFISYLLQNNRKYSKKEMNLLIKQLLTGEADFDVIEAIFPSREGEELVFKDLNGQYEPIIATNFPIRMGIIEQQAAKSLLEDEYITHFLSEKTIKKLRTNTESVITDWSTKDIQVKNVFSGGAIENKKIFGPIISLIAKAIKERKAIIYDNVRKGMFEYRNVSVFPVKIEFSIMNDRFRICAFEPIQNRFLKMNLDTMENIKLSEKIYKEDLEEKYKIFLKDNTRIVKLDIEPIDHVVERCFRIFSYYDRKARYDKQDNKYRLEISYLKFDEAEIVKDILSLGGYVTVIEPKYLQKKIYKRVLAASKLYED